MTNDVASANTRDGKNEGDSQTGGQNNTGAEVPFLVTHWLANYNEMNELPETRDQTQEDALLRIRNAASEIASAFSALGAYGTSSRDVLGEIETQSTEERGFVSTPYPRNATFSDLSRRWSGLSTNHLENIVQSSASTTTALRSAAREHDRSRCITDAAREAESIPSNSKSGQRLGRAMQESNAVIPFVSSALHPSTAITNVSPSLATPYLNRTFEDGESSYKFSLQRQHIQASHQSAEATRRYLSMRQKDLDSKTELKRVRHSIDTQHEVEKTLRTEHALLTNGTAHHTSNGSVTASDEPNSAITRKASAFASKELESKLRDVMTREATCERVIAHLTKRQADLVDSLGKNAGELCRALAEAEGSYKRGIIARSKQRDPLMPDSTCSLSVPPSYSDHHADRMLLNITSRQYQGGGTRHKMVQSYGRTSGTRAMERCRKSLLSRTLSHAVTINSHLSYPVYCLSFDRTGRYFVTGADDFLVKLFRLGGPARPISLGSGDDIAFQGQRNHQFNGRGAVLVCTLRGHAGVICDIDVSMDNALLATASEDGDCRIWGLKDGCPVAILRGHKGGANMVSWSSLTPSRLVTIASDGFARIWDVREAALKRYRSYVGKRSDYLIPFVEKDTGYEQSPSQPLPQSLGTGLSRPIELPPLPPGGGSDNTSTNPDRGDRGPEENVPMPLPPLPPGDGDSSVVRHEREVADLRSDIVEGSFVAGDAVDEGVRLIAQLQHGETVDEALHGPSTRSSGNALKILCVARCPLGGHFVTGSEDGLGRIWSDKDDDRVDAMCERNRDQKCGNDSAMAGRLRLRNPAEGSMRYNPDGRSPSGLLATLSGHVNAITDLSYSHAGDRILTASQRDGVVRIWSWGSESSISTTGTNGCTFGDLRQILVRLTYPAMGKSLPASGTHSSRRRAGNASSRSVPNVCCDVAVWTPDDSKIITSQCCPSQSGSIVQGSQFLLVWDSRSGQCLLGISEAHFQSCNVLVTHPTDSSIFCSAGADGRVSLWDLDTGKCMFAHQNTVDHGPVEPLSDRGKKSGYLDGSFSPDGLRLLLTDDNGRVTVLDADVTKRDYQIRADSSSSDVSDRHVVPYWMKDQYFANDYYELYYDTNGYCVERGSQLPPHLAPRAARCSHSGAPYPDAISRTFRSLTGPVPLPERECRWQRELARSNGRKLRRTGGPLHENVKDTRAVVVAEFDPDRTAIKNLSGDHMIRSNAQKDDGSLGTRAHSRNAPANNRTLSNNYRWGDYDDILREEETKDEDGDTEDEEFVEASNRNGASAYSSDDSSLISEDDEFSDNFESRRSRARRFSTRRNRSARSQRVDRRRRSREHSIAFENQARNQPTRMSARQLLRAAERGPYREPDSDEDFVEYVSTNNEISGPHAEDYTVVGHYFRMPDSAIVKRAWLQRCERRSSYLGTKDYAPQVGDSVVYLPRVHYSTIQNFPTLKAPWQSWPGRSAWPVVRCQIRDIRYRFPYESYYKNRNKSTGRCMSVVAILTLEVTGIPEISRERAFPWPKPKFVSRQTRSSKLSFEVSLFEGSHAPFVIPEQLYLWRLESLESAIGESQQGIEGLRVVAYFVPEEDDSSEDPYMEAYNARLLSVNTKPDEVVDHLCGSGYEALEIQWEPGGDSEYVSPWEISVLESDGDVPVPPCMNEAAKLAVHDLLSNLERRQDVRDWFSAPVDILRYSDYLTRIEIPMDFGFIRKRLDANFYSNKMSVLADIQLLRDNCYKYNGSQNEMSVSATELFEHSQSEIGKIECESLECEDGKVSVDRSPHEDGRCHGYRDRNSRAAHKLDEGSSLECLPPPTAINGSLSSSQNVRPARDAGEQRRMTRSSRAAGNIGRESAVTTSNRLVSTRRRSSEEFQQHDELTSEDSISNKEVSSEEDVSSDDGDNEETTEEENESFSISSDSIRRRSRRRPSTQRSAPRTSPRRTHARISYAEVDSDPRLSEEEMDDASASRNKSDDSHVLRRTSNRRKPNETPPEPTAPRSSPRRTRARHTYTEVDSDSAFPGEESSASENESVGSHVPRGASRRRRNNTSTRRSATRTSSRRTDTRYSYAEVPGIPDEVSSASENETVGSNVPRGASKRGRQNETSARRSAQRSSPRRALARHSYAEVDSDPGLSNEEVGIYNGSEDESVVPAASRGASNRRRRGGTVKRRQAETAPQASETKKRRTSAKRTDQNTTKRELPDLKEFPEIDVSDITNVANAVMERMAEADVENIFAVPVTDTYPEVKDQYDKVIPNPMDYRTIREDRIPAYQSIVELQHDLILIFRNCTSYNKANSVYWSYAITMWEMVNDVFRQVCRELDILLPRRW